MNWNKISVIAFYASVGTFSAYADPTVYSEDINSVRTAVPFLTIAPDSRSSAMGDVGAATSPDANSLHWNSAKYAFIDHDGGAVISYSPWLRGLVHDMNLLYLTGYKRIDRTQTIAASLRYFDMGSIEFYDYAGNFMLNGKPNEFAIDAAYSRKFSDKVSAALAFRYVRSDISSGVTQTAGMKAKAGNSFAADVAVYYRSDVALGEKKGTWALGANISNIGAKISYSNEQEKTFIPINLRIGGSFGIHIDDFNQITLAMDLNKLLVPTPPFRDETGEIVAGENSDVGIVQGMFQSFHDAPGGLTEEMREITYGAGLEYLYRETFAVRTGYFHEYPTKGNRRYFTMGVGLKMNMIGIDFSYLISTQGRTNPMSNTLRFTLLFNFGQMVKTS